MLEFSFQNPVNLVYGSNTISKIEELIPSDSKVLLTYGGGSIKKNGIYDKVLKALTNFTVIEFGGIPSNPNLEYLTPAFDLAKENNIDFILAVGGGSVIDASKFLSVAINHPRDPWNMWCYQDSPESAISLGTILTTPATGSEMNMFSVVSKEETKDKNGFGHPLMYPKFSILDPSVCHSIPEKQLANGIADAFVHTTEQYLTFDVNSPLQDGFAETILKTLINLKTDILEKKDEETLGNFMYSTTLALNGMIGSGTAHDWATHMIGHEITALHGVDHGRTLAIVLPSLLRDQIEKKRAKLEQMAKNVFGKGTAEECIDAIESFFHSLNIGTKFSDYEISESSIQPICEKLKEKGLLKLGEHREITLDVVERILKKAL